MWLIVLLLNDNTILMTYHTYSNLCTILDTGIDIIIVDVLQKEYSVALWSLVSIMLI